MAGGAAAEMRQPLPQQAAGTPTSGSSGAAAASGRPPHQLASAASGSPDAAVAAQAGDREGSAHRRSLISIHADGSGHGGRQYFATMAGMPSGQSTSRQERFQRGREEEYALEVHSLDSRQHPAAAGDGATAGQAALELQQMNGTVAPRHHAIWMVENGSPGSGGGTRGTAPAPAANGSGHGDSTKDVGSGSGPGGGGPPRGGKDSFSGARVLIEEPSERDYMDWGTYFSSLPKKLKGGLDTRLPVPPIRNILWSWLGAFLGILAVCAMNQWVSPEIDIAFLVGSFGASAVLVFAVLESKMSQPRNFLGGQFLSAVVGITTRVIIHQPWIAGPTGMSLALVVMMLTSTTHPPGGATALIAATLPTLPKWHGYSFLVTVVVGSVVMQLIALVVNNLDPRRRYPTFWY